MLSRVFFKAEREKIDALIESAEAAARELEELTEEHAGEEGLLSDVTNDKGKVTKAAVKDRLKALGREDDSDEEREVLEKCLSLMDRESDASKAVKEAQATLDEAVLAKYGELSEGEIKRLVVDEKWFTALASALNAEVDRLTQTLADRIKELETRYAEPLPALERQCRGAGLPRNGTPEDHGDGVVMGDATEAREPRPGYGAGEERVPPGYKRTEVGVIPEGWEAVGLSALVAIRTGPFGSALHRADYVSGGVPLINPLNIVDDLAVPDDRITVSESAANRLADYRLEVGDILIARRGDIGRSTLITRSEKG